ncbi:hypothetical protein GCM10023116_12990 [Kistimonas scapharcae]|uniref:Uncharacterized protein n=1 Tax=Kistimonas scapharcae TaxID=1036133 RepID=A0ABP8V1S7_9GAMM
MVTRLQDDTLGQGIALAHAWFPGRHIDEDAIGEAIWLEKHRSSNLKNLVTEAVCSAFKGR